MPTKEDLAILTREDIHRKIKDSQKAIKKLREEAKQRNHLADKIAKGCARLRKQLKDEE